MTWLSSIFSALLKIFSSWFSKRELEEKHVVIHKTDSLYEELTTLNARIIAAADAGDSFLQDELLRQRSTLTARLKALRLAQRDEG